MTVPDQLGVLSTVCRWFADQGVSIDAAGISTVDGVVKDVFLVRGEFDVDALADHLSESDRWQLPNPAALLGGLLRCVRLPGAARFIEG